MKWWEHTRKESNIDFVKRISIERAKQSRKKSNDKYMKSEKGKKTRTDYWHSDNGKQVMKTYMKSEKGKEAVKKCSSKSKAKRRRNLRWIPLFGNPFPEDVKVHYHHINNVFVIPIPDLTHINTYGNNHRERCNVWINKLFGFIGVNNNE